MKETCRLVFLMLALSSLNASAKDDSLTAVFGTPANREAVEKWEMSACAMAIDWDAAKKQGKGLMFPAGAYREVPAAVSRVIRHVLLSASTYPFPTEEKDCIPDYHVRVRFRRGEESLDVSFCFGCDVLQVHRGTTVVSEVDFDSGSDELFAALFSMFPDDPTFRMYDERRRKWRERRQEKANQSSEPTPTSGTSAAEQPLVPAAVVAHL